MADDLPHRLAFITAHPATLAPAAGDAVRAVQGFESWAAEAASRAETDAVLARAMTEVAALPPARSWLAAIFGNSPFLTRLALRDPDVVIALMSEGPDASFAELLAMLNREEGGELQPALMTRLRRAKRRAALIAGMADLAGFWPLESVTGALSGFAEAALRLALRHLLRAMAKLGQIRLADPDAPERECGVTVLGMGKLGARELNYSSDIDLIILYDAEKVGIGDPDRLQPAMSRLARDLVKLMEERTAEGYVFRTDLRLRPDPASTPPAVSVDMAESYYGSIGQNWERAAMIKARPVAGDDAAGRAFLKILTPFLWRKHLDFAAIRDILSIKRQIDARHGGSPTSLAGHNVKLGHGGIREIEFFVQTQQLIWGGRLPALRSPGTVETLETLAASGHVDPAVARDLVEAYRYLRQVEHRLQMVDDLQTHSLPTDPAEIERFAVFMGYADRAGFEGALGAVLGLVQGHFAGMYLRAPTLSADGNLVFTGVEDDPETLETITRLGFQDAPRIAETVRGWHHGRIRATRSERARELLTELVPGLLRILGKTAQPDVAFARFDEFLGHLPAGVQLLSLFQARPELLSLVAEIMGEAPGLAARLSSKPLLLDAVLTGSFFAPLSAEPEEAEQARDLALLLERARDFEDVLDLTRRWTGEQKFRIGVHLMQGRIDGDRSAKHLSAVAETVLEALLPSVAAQLMAQHGSVPGGRFAVLGLGKLGSRELTARSDLDLVFVYDAPPDVEGSDGPKPLAVSAYYARLGQRLISALSARTTEGALYEVDMRLRPSGSAGPIASSLAAFKRYHENDAWTWEHMALTRARPVAGNESLRHEIAAAIRAVLTRRRDADDLLRDVAEMRRRIRLQHPHPAAWDVKHRSGGMVDIEFVAQYLQLRHAHDRPDILAVETAASLDRMAGAKLLDQTAAWVLRDALKLWHRIQSGLRASLDTPEEDDIDRDLLDRVLARATGILDAETRQADVDRTAAAIAAYYQTLIERPADALPPLPPESHKGNDPP
jgi:glutamate-ammonia-ligase adenylyltransferase